VWAAQESGFRRWLRPACLVGVAFTVVFWCGLLLAALVPAPTMNRLFARLGNKEPDKPTAELYGWPALGEYLDSDGQKKGTDSQTVVIAISYAQASLAMHYSRKLEFAFSLDEGRSPYGQQFQLWGPLSKIPIGCDAILFRAGRIADEASFQSGLARLFDRVERIDTGQSGFDPHLAYFSIWKGFNYRGGFAPSLPAGR
jgi:hypothetical protein